VGLGICLILAGVLVLAGSDAKDAPP